MPDDHVPSGPPAQQPENPRENAGAGRQDAQRPIESVEEHRGSADAARNEAEQLVPGRMSLNAFPPGPRLFGDG